VRGAKRLALGAVDGVQIDGRAWRSPGGLTCRELEMAVGEARLDALRLFTDRQILFASPVLGEASVTFSEADFDAFLAHRLVGPAAVLAGPGGSGGGRAGAESGRSRLPAPPPFTFSPHSCRISDGRVAFGGEWGPGRPHTLALVRASPDAAAGGALPIDVVPETTPLAGSCGEGGSAEAQLLSVLMRSWFGGLRVDLDGATLGPIRELSTELPTAVAAASSRPGERSGDGATGPGPRLVRLRMGLRVRRFPSLPPKF
jgi:hypothetical protein